MLRLPRSLALIFLVVVATYAAEGFITVVLPPYLQSQGVPLDYIGALVSALALASLFSRLPAGLLYRPRRANRSIPAARRAAPPSGKKAPRGVRVTLAAMANPGILLAALLLFCLNLMNQMYVAFFTLYALAIGLSLTAVGMLRAAGSFGAIFTRVFAGELGR